MRTYTTPGVYFETLDEPAGQGAGPVRVDVAAFVGIAAMGPLHRPVRVTSWTQFTGVFGTHLPQAHLAYAVRGFYENGGRVCWIVRTANPDRAAAGRVRLLDRTGNAVLELTAATPGSWSRLLTATVSGAPGDRFTLNLRLRGGTYEQWTGLSADPDDSRYAVHVLNHPESGSALVTAHGITSAAGHGNPPPVRPEHDVLRGGSDGLDSLATAHFAAAIDTLAAVDEVSTLAVPDALPKPAPPESQARPEPHRCAVLPSPEPLSPPPPEPAPQWPPEPVTADIQEHAVRHCELLKYRMAVLDVPDGRQALPAVLEWRAGLSDSSRAALYHPWLRMTDPLGAPGDLVSVPPCGHVAGVYARTGVARSPANEALQAASDVRYRLDDPTHGELNTAGVNVVRAYPGRGLRVAGSRTLSRDPAWRHVTVRRLMSMIEKTVERDTQWTVFEPDGPPLWRDLDRVARSLLDTLWRGGLLDGATADEAYSVVCDATTNPVPVDGHVTCVIGVRPPVPAEFVVVRIGRTRGEIHIDEERGSGRG